MIIVGIRVRELPEIFMERVIVLVTTSVSCTRARIGMLPRFVNNFEHHLLDNMSARFI